MRKLFWLVLLMVGLSGGAFAQTYQKIQGFCENGGSTVTTDGRTSTTKVQRSYPSCTITVYDTGTTNLASIASNSSGTPKSNPFTADSDGYWSWFALAGEYDVKMSGGGLASPITRSGYWIVDGGGGGSGITGSGTTDRFPIFTGSSSIGNSVFKQVGTSEFTPAATGKRINLGTGSQQVVEIANASVGGTTQNRIAKLSGAPSTALTATVTDTTKLVGIVIAGAGTTGNAQIVTNGNVACDFDGATTAGDYVGASTTSAGKCTDLGSSLPTSGVQVLGRVLSTIASAGSATVYVFTGEQGRGGTAGSGTTNYLPYWVDANTLGATNAIYSIASQLFQFGYSVDIANGGLSELTLETDQIIFKGGVSRANNAIMQTMKATASQTGDFQRFTTSGGSIRYRVDIDGDVLARGVNYTWPSSLPVSTGCLQINTSGVMSVVSCVTGSVTYEVQAYNVKNDGGCVGDGVTNDTSCVAAAYTAALAASRPLYFPTGNYQVDGGTLVVATNSVTIFGDGPARSIITNRTAGSVITLDNTSNITHSVTIRDLSLVGAGSGSSDVGITVSGVGQEPYGLTVNNVTIGNMGGKGIYVSNNLFTSRFVDVDVSVNSSGTNGIDISGAADIVLENCYVHTVGTNGAAYRIHAGTATLIGCNGIDSGTTADWIVLGDSTGTGDPTDRYARVNLISSNIEAFTNRGVYAKSGSYVNKYEAVTFLAPATGTVTPIKYDFVDTGQRGTWDAASSINTQGASYTNGKAINSSGAPFVQIGGTTFTDYYDTGAVGILTLPYLTTQLVAGSSNTAIKTSRAQITALESSGLVGDLTGAASYTGDPARVILQAGTNSRPTLASTDVNTTGIYFPTAGTTLGFTVSGTQRLLLGSNHTLTGNLGINTSGGATYALDIASGPLRVTNSNGSSTAAVEAKGDTNPYYLLTDTSASAIIGRMQAISGAPDRLVVGSFSNHPLGLYTNSTEKWTVLAAGDFVPGTASTYSLGSSTLPVLNLTLNNKLFWNGTTVFDLTGSGTPEGSVTASVGSVYRRTNGASGTTLYIKETGSGNTGWTAVNSGSPTLTATYVGYGNGSNVLTGTSDYTYSTSTKTLSVINGSGASTLVLNGSSDTSSVKFGAASVPGNQGGIFFPFVGGGQSTGPGVWWGSSASYASLSGLWVSFGLNWQGANSSHDPFMIREGTGTSSNGTIRYQWSPSSSLFEETLSTAATGTAFNTHKVTLTSTGTAAANFGAYDLYVLENGSGSNVNAVQLSKTWTTATAGAETGKFTVATNLAGLGVGDAFTVDGGQYYGTLWNKGNISGSVTLDFINGNTVTATLTGNVTSLAFSNLRTGGVYFIHFIQDALGPWTLTVPAALKVNGGYTISAGINKRDLLICSATSTTQLYCSKAQDQQ